MIEINLLPKNYLKRQGSFSFGKSGVYAAVGAVGVALMLIVVTFYQIKQVKTLETGINKANERAAMLQKDIRLVDGLIDVKEKINRRLEAVDRLDRHRTVWVRILQDVAANVPDFVWLGEVREKKAESKPAEGAKIESSMPDKKNAQQVASAPKLDSLPEFSRAEIEGYAFTLNAVAAFMINLMRSDYFDQVDLVSSEETKFNGNDKAYKFVVSCNVHYLSDEQMRTLVAQRVDEEDQFNEADYEEAVPTAPTETPIATMQN